MQPRTVMWSQRAPVLDQGDIGGCTGFALSQCLNTTFFAGSRPRRRYLNHDDAVRLYSLATTADDIPGSYPPEDTGSTALGVCKAGVAQHYLSGYRHTFSWQHFAEAIALSPVIAGINWYETMFDVDTKWFIRPEGEIVGGHEIAVIGYTTGYVTILNSWGNWGHNGRARITCEDFARLLDEDGDVTVPIGVG